MRAEIVIHVYRVEIYSTALLEDNLVNNLQYFNIAT